MKISDFDFIKDDDLRKNLEHAIDFISILQTEQLKKKSSIPTYREEIHRIIIVYIVAIIEAILFYFYKIHKKNATKSIYQNIHYLPERFCDHTKNTQRIVIAVEEQVTKQDHEIGLHDLVIFFKEKRLISKELAQAILETNAIRNTLHLTKKRKTACDVNHVELALKNLLDILNAFAKDNA